MLEQILAKLLFLTSVNLGQFKVHSVWSEPKRITSHQERLLRFDISKNWRTSKNFSEQLYQKMQESLPSWREEVYSKIVDTITYKLLS